MLEKLHLQVIGSLLGASLLGVLAASSACSSDSTGDNGQTSSSTSSGGGSDGGSSSSGATSSSSSGATSSGATSSGATSSGSSGATGEIWGCVEAGGSCICQPTDKKNESTCTGTYKCCFSVPFAGTTRCQCQDPGTSKCEDLATGVGPGKVVPKCPPL